jgi:hypothetical protein
MKLKTVAMTGVLSLAGLGLVGAGAHAVFTTSTTSSQTITAGTPSVVLYSPTATAGNNSDTLTLAPVGAVGSSFVSTEQDITLTNNGDIPVTEFTIQVSDAPANSAGTPLASEMSMCLTSDGYIMYNGPLRAPGGSSGFSAGASAGSEDLITLDANPPYVLAPTETDHYTMMFYAGTEDTGCGTWSGWSSWQNGDFSAYPVTGTQGVWSSNADIAPTTEYDGTPLAGDSNASALNSDAEGGIDTVTFTFNFQA